MEANIVCVGCKRFDETDLTCEAFPKGIPDDIISGENIHIEKHPDQKNDIVFEPIEKE